MPGTSTYSVRRVDRVKAVLTYLSRPSHAPSTGSSSSANEIMASGTTGRKLPTFDELPPFKDFTGCAWEVWGKDDQLGTINLLTDEVVKEASKEIKYVFLSTFRMKSKRTSNASALSLEPPLTMFCALVGRARRYV